MAEKNSNPFEEQKTWGVILVIVGIVCASGFFMGMRQTRIEVASPTRVAEPAPSDWSHLPPAPKYSEIPEAEWLANRNWNFNVQQLPRYEVDLSDSEPAPLSEVATALVVRKQNRAYDGAPPTIPHEIDQLSSAACMVCHSTESRLQVGTERPSPISHPYFANCTQCHVPGDGLRLLSEREKLLVANSFEGRQAGQHGSRAYPGAPPTLPHPVWMRQNCMSCHGPGQENAIRTSHPSRQNCLQCHAPNASLDNREQLVGVPPTPPSP